MAFSPRRSTTATSGLLQQSRRVEGHHGQVEIAGRAGRVVDTLGPGDYFGELSLLDPASRDATITADGSLSVVSLSRVAFTQALDEIPTFRDSLLTGMARRLHELAAIRQRMAPLCD